MMPPVDLTQPRHVREQQLRDHITRDEERGAALLAQCPGLTLEKRTLFERLHARDPRSSFQWPLVRDLAEERRAELAAASVGDDDLIDLLIEIARHDPPLVRRYHDRLTHEPLRATCRAEGPDAWADEYRAAYQQDRDLRHIKALGELHSEHAADLLYALGREAPDEHLPMIALAMEACGMFAHNKHAAWCSDAFRAYVVARDESPHHFGRGYDQPVPVCKQCGTPAERLITLDAESTQDAFSLEVSPTFFWWRCHCDNGNLLHVAQGDIRVDTPMSTGPVDSPIPHGSWLLEKVERSVVAAHPARPGRGEHQVGGAPTWIRKTFHPRVPDIEEQRGMCFLASFDLKRIPLGWATGHEGIAYCFWDVESRIAVTQLQLESGDASRTHHPQR